MPTHSHTTYFTQYKRANKVQITVKYKIFQICSPFSAYVEIPFGNSKINDKSQYYLVGQIKANIIDGVIDKENQKGRNIYITEDKKDGERDIIKINSYPLYPGKTVCFYSSITCSESSEIRITFNKK